MSDKSAKAIGICLGSCTVTVVRDNGGKKPEILRLRHGGNPEKALNEILNSKGGQRIAVTGRKLRKAIGLSEISEPEAICEVLKKTPSGNLPEAIVSFGGQAILIYLLDKKGKIVDAYTFNKCGSGTGEFFLQQIKRLGLDTIEQAMDAALKEDSLQKPYIPASRCSVFCKSDCTHATNEGKATIGQIAAGLCLMISQKIGELLAKVSARKIWLIGGGSEISQVPKYLSELGYEVEIPEEALYLEALGAYYFAKNNKQLVISQNPKTDFKKKTSFSFLPPLNKVADLIDFKAMPKSRAEAGDKCLLAVDVGSTTTKLVLIRQKDMSIVGWYYGYTLGKPHLATLKGLEYLQEKIGVSIEINGIAVTGSGRYLAETFLTDFRNRAGSKKMARQVMVFNEIVCHASAASHFNPGVKTILEIGGQDAKYTFLQNGVPVDFVMNEACSAGTGSFLAEVVKEIFGIDDPSKIGPEALQGQNPIKFGEQCSAFIESDINTALQEGLLRQDILAGLCYSICYNYLNRVVGNRQITGPISLQGGTAYNRAFCYAMAQVLKTNKNLLPAEKVVVNEDAGLMGAVGVGLELKKKIDAGEYEQIKTNLPSLLKKTLEEGKTFICKGCDYKCSVQNFVIDGVSVPFGGYCRRWDCVRRQEKEIDPNDFDFTIWRDQQLQEFSNLGEKFPRDWHAVGFLGTFFETTYLPFLSNFFARLGYRPIIADRVLQDGVKRQGAAFCYPIERAHGLLADLIEKDPAFFWLPQLKGVQAGEIGDNFNNCCPFIQGSGFVLSATFSEIAPERILNPYLDFSQPKKEIQKQLSAIAGKIFSSKREIKKVVDFAWQRQEEFSRKIREKGRELLADLEKNPEKIAFVLFGRPYNAFSGRLGANKGISRKAASLGVPVIPLDFLPIEELAPEEGMFWPSGQQILKGARFVKNHPQLFAIYLTNFSCGPDSFINFKFRHYQGEKPSLTLEFDGHTANAGFDTRIEAFFDIIKGYKSARVAPKKKIFTPAFLAREKKSLFVQTSDGGSFALTHPRVRIVFPDMGRFCTEAVAESTSSLGIRSLALPPPDQDCLQLGRRYSSCKECLPYNLTLGSFLKYLENRPKGEKTVLFMPESTGPCRFGQYNRFMRLIIEKLCLEDVAIFSPSCRNRYEGMGHHFSERAWIAVVTASGFHNISNALLTLANDPEEAQDMLTREWLKIRREIRQGVTWKNFQDYRESLSYSARTLARIPLRKPFLQAPKILITGEIYVRLAQISTQQILEELVKRGFVVVQTPPTEWVKYIDHIIVNNLYPESGFGILARLKQRLKLIPQRKYETAIYRALGQSGLMYSETDKVEDFLKTASPYISPEMKGEAILTVGSSLHEVFNRYAGIVVLGPFGCMPTRIASSILFYKMRAEEKVRQEPDNEKVRKLAEKFSHCPVLFFESDGSPLPPITESQLEVFSLISKQVGEAMASQ